MITENNDYEDELNIMVNSGTKANERNANGTYLNNEALNQMNMDKSKTPSTAAHGSIKNNMSTSFDDMGSVEFNG